jgi:hypothetical protein
VGDAPRANAVAQHLFALNQDDGTAGHPAW